MHGKHRPISKFEGFAAFAGFVCWFIFPSAFTIVLLRLNMSQTQAATEKNERSFDEVTIRICEKLGRLPRLTNVCSIYKVPDRLRLGNEGDYTPKVVSIGPFHHGKQELQTMEEHKNRYLLDFLARGPAKPIHDGVSHYVHLIKEKEAELRSAYAESINLGSDEFASMILVDTAFTIEVLLRLCNSRFRDAHDRIFNKPYMINDILPDMVLLENQLPLFIIKDLYETLNAGKHPPINELLVTFVSKLLDWDLEIKAAFVCKLLDCDLAMDENTPLYTVERRRPVANTEEHLVDLLRSIYIPTFVSSETWENAIIPTPSSVELSQAGVQFEMMNPKDPCNSPLHYTDSSSVLKIRKMTVSRETEVAVMNLLAFEQCHRIDMSPNANGFVAFLDCLIHSSKDVDLLVKQKIIDNRLADTSCAYTVIKKLGNAAAVSSQSFCFAGICKNLNRYHKSRRSRVKATLNKWAISLRKNYFYSPWAIISVIAAFILLVLTFIQTVCSVMSV